MATRSETAESWGIVGAMAVVACRRKSASEKDALTRFESGRALGRKAAKQTGTVIRRVDGTAAREAMEARSFRIDKAAGRSGGTFLTGTSEQEREVPPFNGREALRPFPCSSSVW